MEPGKGMRILSRTWEWKQIWYGRSSKKMERSGVGKIAMLEL